MTNRTQGPSTISVSFVKGCLASLSDESYSELKAKLLDKCEIRHEILAQEKGRVRSDAFAKLLRLMSMELGDEYLGFGKSVSKPGSF